jgi:hypothetical protein
MKDQTIVGEVKVTSPEKIAEIKANINKYWDEVDTLPELAKYITNGYIFGFGKNAFDASSPNEHFTVDEINQYCNEVYLEKNPPIVVEEPAIEEPIVEEPLIP